MADPRVVNGYVIGPNANLEGAILMDANLSGANLGDADLTDADLTDANLTGVRWKYTTCPNGIVTIKKPCKR